MSATLHTPSDTLRADLRERVKALVNETLEKAAQMCEQRAYSSRDTGTPSGMAHQCAADIRAMKTDTTKATGSEHV